MNEPVREQLNLHRGKYDHFVRATKLGYKDLYELHTRCVKILDDDLEYGIVSPMIICNARLLAYLTDKELSEIAIGADVSGNVYPSIF